MSTVGVWSIGEGGRPERLVADQAFLEQHLEDWIQHDPSLISTGITWVARQLVLPDGSRLDLLGLMGDGTWVVTELKRGSVSSGTLVQVMHYFLELSMMSNRDLVHRVRSQGHCDAATGAQLDELAEDDTSREHLLVVAGVGGGDSAEAAARVLADAGFRVPVRVITFQLLCDSDGRRILVRDVEEEDERPTKSSAGWSYESLLEKATELGVREELELVRQDLEAAGYRVSQKKNGLNFNSGSRRQTFWVSLEDGALRMGCLTGNFPTLYGVDDQVAEDALGRNWISLPAGEARSQMQEWIRTISQLRQAAPASREEAPESTPVDTTDVPFAAPLGERPDTP